MRGGETSSGVEETKRSDTTTAKDLAMHARLQHPRRCVFYLSQALQGGVHVARVAQVDQARRENGAALGEVLRKNTTVDRAGATSRDACLGELPNERTANSLNRSRQKRGESAGTTGESSLHTPPDGSQTAAAEAEAERTPATHELATSSLL